GLNRPRIRGDVGRILAVMDAEDRPGAGQRDQRDESDQSDPGYETGRREDGEEDEGGTDENLVQGDGLFEPDSRRNRPLPSPWVRHVFGQVRERTSPIRPPTA